MLVNLEDSDKNNYLIFMDNASIHRMLDFMEFYSNKKT